MPFARDADAISLRRVISPTVARRAVGKAQLKKTFPLALLDGKPMTGFQEIAESNHSDHAALVVGIDAGQPADAVFRHSPTRPGDHRALFWVFFAFTPAQFVMVGLQLYDVYSVLIPVYAFLFILARVAFSGDFKRFLERTAKIQAGLLICVYCLSHVPSLMYLPDLIYRTALDRQAANSPPDPWAGARLLFFFVLIVQLADAMQYLSGKLFGRRVIAPTISPNKTWEGLLGGVGGTTLLGTALYWATPFQVWQAAILSLVIALMGFAGSITMSAIKRDRGVKDYGTLVEGHSGVLNRIDSICFAAPVCYHLSRLFLMTG